MSEKKWVGMSGFFCIFCFYLPVFFSIQTIEMHILAVIMLHQHKFCVYKGKRKLKLPITCENFVLTQHLFRLSNVHCDHTWRKCCNIFSPPDLHLYCKYVRQQKMALIQVCTSEKYEISGFLCEIIINTCIL